MCIELRFGVKSTEKDMQHLNDSDPIEEVQRCQYSNDDDDDVQDIEVEVHSDEMSDVDGDMDESAQDGMRTEQDDEQVNDNSHADHYKSECSQTLPCKCALGMGSGNQSAERKILNVSNIPYQAVWKTRRQKILLKEWCIPTGTPW